MTADQITGELIHLEMRRRRMSQATLGAQIGITQAALGKKLYGKRRWTIDEVIAVARYLEVPVTDLLPGEDYTPETTEAPVDFSTEASGLSQHSVRSKGLEPPTFWLVVADAVCRWNTRRKFDQITRHLSGEFVGLRQD